ncbi:MAG: DNA topoisomerase 3 [Muribaculaceae bacterium]|nr:DNA topoisomerase 3 [Muribaculaceae bacterium]
MILCITEKPSVGGDIAKILGAVNRRDGYFEGNGYCVTWTFGHLCTLKDPADYTKYWKTWSFGALPMIPPKFGIKLIPDRGIEHQFEVIRRLIGECDEVVNCGDAGQEGELIQRWVMQKAGCTKPVKRLWISSLTDEAIIEGFKNLRPQKDLEPLYIAGLCRAIGDWILGINGTRLYTLKFGVNHQILSVGRVQTPTLALIVNRQQEIENFKPQDSWELRTIYRDVSFGSGKIFKTEKEGKKAVEALSGEMFTITDISKKSGKEAPPRLFDLTSLQVEANKKFGYSADLTLKTIQSLYEKKVATYPRVDTTYLTEDIFPKCKGILNSLTHYQSILEGIRGKQLRKSKKVFDNSKVTDHHAIIPTGQPLPPGISEEERNIFDTIAKRFISVFFPDCSFEQTTVKGKVDKQEFKATGKVIIDKGWKAVYAKEESQPATEGSEKERDKEDSEKVLPQFEKEESGPQKPYLSKKTTQPPKYFTEGTLLKAMETAGSAIDDEDLREALKANGIGRPSTRAAIIETLYKRGYIRKERKSLRATPEGCELISLIHEELLKSPKLTGIWEGRLRQIERGTYSAEEFIGQLKTMISEITRQVIADTSNRRIGVISTAESPKGEKNRRKTSKKSE